MKIDPEFKQSFLVGSAIALVVVTTVLANTFESVAADYSFKPSITVSEEYTDNVFLNSLAQKSDFITRIRPGFTSKYSAPFWEWDISYAYDYRYYAKGSRKNDDTHEAAARGLIKLIDERLFLELSDTYKRVSLDSVRDTTSESLFFNQTDSNTAVISPYIVLRPTAATMLKTGYRYINTLYTDSSAVDTISHVGFLESTYEVAPNLSINVEYSFIRQENDLQQFNRHNAYLGSRYEYADKSFIFAMGGASFASYNNGTETKNPIWKGGLTHTFETVIVNLLTEAKYTDNTQGSTNLTKTYSASLQKLFARGTLTVYGTYLDYSAAENLISSTSSVSVDQDRKSYSCGFSSKYELLDKLNGSLGLAYQHITNEQQQSITRQYLVNSALDYTFADELTASLIYYYSDSSSAQIALDNRKVNRVILEVRKVF